MPENALIAAPNAPSLPARIAQHRTPTLFAGDDARERRFWQFFGAEIRNPNTRMAYLTAAYRFADWCATRGLKLERLEPLHVAAYVERLTATYAPATVKQNLAALRMLFDYLVIGQVIPANPASAVRGPKHVVRTGKTPVLSAEETRALFDRIETDSVVGLRDRALIGVYVYSFARVSATIGMTVADYYHQGKRSYFRLHEKGGKYNVVPAHHVAQEYVDAYLEAARIGDQRATPLFRASNSSRSRNCLTERAMTRHTALQMIKRRVADVGLPQEVCNHSFRGTGITEYLHNGGAIEIAARIAGHESTRTTQLYDRTNDELSLDEIERIHI